jgi:hypothetical protein
VTLEERDIINQHPTSIFTRGFENISTDWDDHGDPQRRLDAGGRDLGAQVIGRRRTDLCWGDGKLYDTKKG